jgi:hypothetical protein
LSLHNPVSDERTSRCDTVNDAAFINNQGSGDEQITDSRAGHTGCAVRSVVLNAPRVEDNDICVSSRLQSAFSPGSRTGSLKTLGWHERHLSHRVKEGEAALFSDVARKHTCVRARITGMGPHAVAPDHDERVSNDGIHQCVRIHMYQDIARFGQRAQCVEPLSGETFAGLW